MKSYVISALHKVMPQETDFAHQQTFYTVKNDSAYFQWVILLDRDSKPMVECKLKADSLLNCEIKKVSFVPNVLPAREGADDYVISTEVGLYPDALETVDLDKVLLNPAVPNVFYIKADTRDLSGIFSVGLSLSSQEKTIAAATVSITVANVILPPSQCRYTDWIHYDAIAEAHHVRLFERKFYDVFASYLDLAVQSGMNMLMIPAFTPALDTWVGGDRLTAQLTKITRDSQGDYHFDFDQMGEFLDFVTRHGIRYFEFPPLFCQWTAAYGVKFEIDGKAEFGWKIASDDPKYLSFLEAFLKALGLYLKQTGRLSDCYFHLSDELNNASDERFARFRKMMKDSLAGAHFFDTVAYAEGRADGFEEVVALNHADEGILQGHQVSAVYYCWEQSKGRVSNRFLNMPLARTAVIGAQMYLNNATLLLHWGFNFYNSALSIDTLDPYFDTTCGGVYPGGDAFVVYPDRTRQCAAPSLRLYAMSRAFRIYRLLQLLEALCGREEVLSLLKQEGLQGYGEYPLQEYWLESFETRLISSCVSCQRESE